MFIEKLNFTADTATMLLDLSTTLNSVEWPITTILDNGRYYGANQIGLKHRIGAVYPWYDANGTLYDTKRQQFFAKESDFTEWNDVGEYTKQKILELSDQIKIKFGRVRFMRLLPKTGLSVHADLEPRYHFVLNTNQYAYFGLSEPDGDITARCYHIPADGHFYKVDTLKNHFVYNGGPEPRIHLVLAEA